MFVPGICLLVLLAQMISVQILLTVDSALINHWNDSKLVLWLAVRENS